MDKNVTRATEENARKLVRAISEHLADGSKLPKLTELEGTKILLNVENGRLNWQLVVSEHISYW